MLVLSRMHIARNVERRQEEACGKLVPKDRKNRVFQLKCDKISIIFSFRYIVVYLNVNDLSTP